jgi:hypothetical protein
MKIKSVHFGVAVVIVAVLLVSVAALTQPKLFQQNQSASCTLDLSGYAEDGACSDILSIHSGAPGTMVTVTVSDFGTPPIDVATSYSYQYPSNQNIQYSIYFERATPFNDVDAASGQLTCSTLACAGDSRAAIFLDSGYFSNTFAVPNVPPGTYNVIVTLTYAPPINAAYYNENNYLAGTFGESTTTTFTVT